MRWNHWTVLSLSLSACVVASPPTTAQQQAAGARTPAAKPAPKPPIDPDGSRMQLILDQWAKQSSKLTSLDVKIRRVDDSGRWGHEEYEGQAKFKAPNLAMLDFLKLVEKKDSDPKKPVKELVHHERIICTGKDVWQYKSPEHQIFIHELGKAEQERALQEGPLPFLFNFRAENAKKRYRMVLTREDDKSYVILVVPLMPIDKECFSHALIQLDKRWLLPTRIVLTDPEGKSQKDFQLRDIKPNAPVADANFQGKRLPSPWVVRVNKEGDTPQPQPLGKDARIPQPAQRAPRRGGQVR